MGNSSSLDASGGALVIRPDEVPLEKGEKHRLTLRRLVRRDHHGPGLSVTWIALRGVQHRKA